MGAEARRPEVALRTRVVIITGVSGSGKSTVGRAAAERLGWRFVDADDLHSEEAIGRIQQGRPLDDAIRRPWLQRVRGIIESAIAQQETVVIACSALKGSYRDLLATGLDGIRFVFLSADPPVLRARLAARTGHFAGPDLLDSQLQTLEPPEDALWLDATQPVERLVDAIVEDLDTGG